MPVQIIHKKSAVAGAVPQTSALQLGEFAVNTADGEVFFVALQDPAGGTGAANKFVFNTQRPPKADGGEITDGGTPPPSTSGTPLMLAEMLDSIYNYDWYN
jgi:hypothetical protein